MRKGWRNAFIVGFSLIFIFEGFSYFGGQKIVNDNNRKTTLNQQTIKQLKTENERISGAIADGSALDDVQATNSRMGSLIQQVVDQQNIIAKQKLSGPSPEKANDETKNAQRQLSQLIDMKSLSNDPEGMTAKSIGLNWSTIGPDKVTGKPSVLNSKQGGQVLFKVENDGQTNYITASYDKTADKLQKLNEYGVATK